MCGLQGEGTTLGLSKFHNGGYIICSCIQCYELVMWRWME